MIDANAELLQNLISPIQSDMTAPSLCSPKKIIPKTRKESRALSSSSHGGSSLTDDITIEDSESFTTGYEELDLVRNVYILLFLCEQLKIV